MSLNKNESNYNSITINENVLSNIIYLKVN